VSSETMIVVEADAIKLTMEGAKAVSLGLAIGTPENK
jgi:hypothetical protein